MMDPMDATTLFEPTEVLRGRFLPPQPDQARFADKILRGELAAIEAYDHVIEVTIKDPDAPITTLAQIRNEHQRSCESLRQLVTRKGSSPSDEPGAWGTIVNALINVRTFFGPMSALRTLRTGEEHGLKLYQDALDLDLGQRERALIRDVLVPRQVRHMAQLDSLIGKSLDIADRF
jgi:hypothetical protein